MLAHNSSIISLPAFAPPGYPAQRFGAIEPRLLAPREVVPVILFHLHSSAERLAEAPLGQHVAFHSIRGDAPDDVRAALEAHLHAEDDMQAVSS